MIYNKLFNKIEEELNSDKTIKKKEVELKTLFLSFVFISPLLFLIVSNLMSLNFKMILLIIFFIVSITSYLLLLYINKLIILLSIIYSFTSSSTLIFLGMYLKDVLFKYNYNSYVFLTISISIILTVFISNLIYSLDLLKINMFYHKYLIIITFNIIIELIIILILSKVNSCYNFIYNFSLSLLIILFFTFFLIEYKERIRKDIQLNLSLNKEPYLYVLPFTILLTFIADLFKSITFKKR